MVVVVVFVVVVVVVIVYLSIYLPIYLSTYLPIYLSTYPPIYLSTYLPIYLSTYLPTYLPIYLSTYLSIYLFIYLSVCLPVSPAVVYLQAWKRSNSARLPQFLNSTSKTKQFCETSSIFELDNIKNEIMLRDFLNCRSWQHQKRDNSARLPSKMESWVQSWRPRTKRFAIFPLHLSKVLRLAQESDARSYEVLHLSRKIISANLKIWCSKMQPLSGNQEYDGLRLVFFF